MGVVVYIMMLLCGFVCQSCLSKALLQNAMSRLKQLKPALTHTGNLACMPTSQMSINFLIIHVGNFL